MFTLYRMDFRTVSGSGVNTYLTCGSQRGAISLPPRNRAATTVFGCEKLSFFRYDFGGGAKAIWYRVFSHDVTAAMLVSQTNPLGVGLFSYVNNFFCSNKFA